MDPFEAYLTTPNEDPFFAFNKKYGAILGEFQDQFDILSCDMVDFFENSKQKEEEFVRKMNLCKTLKKAISKHNPDWLFNIVPTGSSVTGLATANSDLDVAIHIPQAALILEQRCKGKKIDAEEKKIMWREMQLNILQIVRLVLANNEEISQMIDWEEGVNLVQAQIQILKLKTVDGIEFDISVVMDSFLSSMHNSFLIKHMVLIDHRFGPLCAVVKEWAASTKVKNPKDGGFNSYALVLLVIHYLQCGTFPPVLPNLQFLYRDKNFIAMSEKDFPVRLDFGAALPFPLPKIQKNEAPIARLFLEFLNYYSEFNFDKFYISIKHGKTKIRERSASETVQNENRKQVYIEDPFDSHNPGRTVRSLKNIQKIMRETMDKFDPVKFEKENPHKEKSDYQFPTLSSILKMEALSATVTVETEEEENVVPRTSTASA
ncbi:hypothetical protein GCK72_017218 [Caenorhabditis remanei]|uniref:PAP-associated domain-containing protein n=1 Tax=Caenorhabditis remanei TaxID=31234 RepID=A0A6A5G6P9_CAERE|nr:hypothetical protein GCK72_017218 [Caenorhabditis remanei]KAF1750667.1 hypothetical protein GCK72_017218 [Caenorhabditis remanei]